MLIIIIATVLCIGSWLVCTYVAKNHTWKNLSSGIGNISAMILTMALLCHIGTAACNSASLAHYEQTRYHLVYQLENGLYTSTETQDYDYGTKALYTEITEYNSAVAAGQAGNDNLWVNWMVSDCYDDLELIPLPNQ